MEQFKGKVWVLGDDIDTDIIIPTEYLALPTVEDMKQSFARIFFRNSINNGLLLIENDKIQDAVKEGDEIEVTLGEKITYNGTDYEIHSLPDNLMEIINAGGLVEAMKKRNGVK